MFLNKKVKFDAVIHFPGLNSIKKSTIEPFRNWNLNVKGKINLLNFIEKYNCANLVFSSSATV